MRAQPTVTPPSTRADAGSQGSAQNTEAADLIRSIREARDAVLEKNLDLTAKLVKAEDRISELGDERDEALGARDAALKAATEFARDNEELRAELEKAEAERAQGSGGAESEQARREFEEFVTAISEERNGIRRDLALRNAEVDELRGQLAAAGGAGEKSALLAAELEETRRKLNKANETYERLVATQNTNLAGLVEQLAAAQKARSAEQQKREYAEKQLAAQKRNFESITAALKAELAAKSAPSSPLSPGPQRETEPPPIGESDANGHSEPLSDEEIHEAITAMFGCVAALKDNPKTPDPIAELRARAGVFAARTALGTRRAMHSIAMAVTDFAIYLDRVPAKIEPAVPLLEKAVETLGWLSLRTGAQSLDLTDGLIYAVDDDTDNCECISAALEKVSLRTLYAATPEAALDQIAVNPCDLIILDVDLPRISGFDLHTRIREMPGRQKTPIIFLSGHMSTRERAAALQPDNSRFVSKPYKLSELSLHTLLLIVESRLG
jgi:CheY-like chemotaxis protein